MVDPWSAGCIISAPRPLMLSNIALETANLLSCSLVAVTFELMPGCFLMDLKKKQPEDKLIESKEEKRNKRKKNRKKN